MVGTSAKKINQGSSCDEKEKTETQSKDGKYLKHHGENGLWIKDVVEDKISIINSSKINSNKILYEYMFLGCNSIEFHINNGIL